MATNGTCVMNNYKIRLRHDKIDHGQSVEFIVNIDRNLRDISFVSPGPDYFWKITKMFHNDIEVENFGSIPAGSVIKLIIQNQSGLSIPLRGFLICEE